MLQKYKNLIAEIETARFDHNIGVENAFPTHQNPYCKYCEYQMLCPLWKHLHYGAETINAGELGEQTIASLVDQYAQLSSQISQDTKQKDFLKDLLIVYASEHDFQQLFGSDSKIGITKKQIFSAKDKLALQKLLSELGILDEYSDIPYQKLASLVKDKKLTSDQISSLLSVKDSRTLKASKKKSGE